ncbi:MAG TPA: hypothetical protein VGC70_06315 [Burkholderiales bacterium]
MTAADVAIGAFTLCNSVRVFAYIPQIVLIGRDKTGVAAISYSTWGLFVASHLSTVVYAAVAVHDLKMALIFVANTVCCAAILGLTYYKRRQHRATLAGQSAPAAWIEGTDPAITPALESSRPGFKLRLIVNPAFTRSRGPVPMMEEWRRRVAS